MSNTEDAGGALAGNVLFYQRPEPLNPEVHGRLGLNRVDKPFAFAETAHAVPLTVTEFGPAGACYPIIFGGEAYAPLAVMSIRPNENLFVKDGIFQADAYVPAFIRRYPFVLANDEGNQRLLVCIDRAAPMIAEDGEVRLFENGEPTEFARNCIQFCTDFETERQRTESFVQMLRDLDLLESKQAMFTPRNPDGTAGEPIQIADYFGVSEAKLNALPADKLAELRDNGALQQIYAHLNSLFGWDRLIAVTLQRSPQAASA